MGGIQSTFNIYCIYGNVDGLHNLLNNNLNEINITASDNLALQFACQRTQDR